jgi:hypothetical protein
MAIDINKLAKLINEDASVPGSSLADRLNNGNVAPKVMGGSITFYDVETGSGIPQAEFDIIESYCEEHPDGMDRGGIVVVVKSSDDAAFFHVASGWEPYAS